MMSSKTLTLFSLLTTAVIATDCVVPSFNGPNAGVNLFVEVDLQSSNEQPELLNTLDRAFLKTLNDVFGLCSPETRTTATGSPTSALDTPSPSSKPSKIPTKAPTIAPTLAPTLAPTPKATSKPSISPTKMPSLAPTLPKPTKTPSKPTSPGAVDDFDFFPGTCRTENMDEGVEGVDWIVVDGLNFSECLDECRSDDGCKGFEHVASYCEIWKNYPPKEDPSYPNHVCFKKKDSSKPTSKPASKPSTKPTMPAPVDDFEYNQGTCRTENMTEGKEGVDWIAMEGMTFAACLTECRNDSGCKAFEHVESYCEIWKTLPPKSDSSFRNHVCFKKNGNPTKPSGKPATKPSKPTMPAPADDFEYNQGTCRTQNMEVGSEGADWIAMDGMTFAECIAECRKDSGCKGFEHVESYCEIWMTVPQQVDSSYPNHVCFKKKDSTKPASKPTKKPTQTASVEGFEYDQGTCRTDSMEVGTEGVDWIAMDGMTFNECLAECRGNGHCKGFEHVESYCEIWKTVPAKVDSSFPNHLCFRKKDATSKPKPTKPAPKPATKPATKPTKKPTTSHITDFDFYQGTCRTEGMETGTEGVDWHSKEGLNLSECLTECYNDAGCKAVEHVDSYCELWTMLPPRQDASFASHGCYKKNGATEATTKPKPTKPVMKPTPSPTYKPKPAPKPVAKPTATSFVDDFAYFKGTCRTGDMGAGEDGVDWIAKRGVNFADCLMECYKDDGCKAIEHTGTYCELWKHFPPNQDNSFNNHVCYKKKNTSSKPLSTKPSHQSKPNDEWWPDRKRSLQTSGRVTGIVIQNSEVVGSESCEPASGEACRVVFNDVVVFADDEATAQEAAARVVELLNDASTNGALFSEEIPAGDIENVRISTRIGLPVVEPDDEDSDIAPLDEDDDNNGGRSTTFKVLMSLLGLLLAILICLLIYFLFFRKAEEEEEETTEEEVDEENKEERNEDATLADEAAMSDDDGMVDVPDTPPVAPTGDSPTTENQTVEV